MSVRVEVVCVDAEGDEQRREILSIDRPELAMETLGMTLNEGKALLAGVQDIAAAQQVMIICSGAGCVHPAASGTPIKIPAARQ